MSWGAVIGAGGAIIGGLLGSQGGSQSTAVKPWGGVKPYLLDLYRNAAGTPQQQFYPGQTSIGALPEELAAWGNRAGYNSSMFGAGSPFQGALGALGSQFGGQDALGQMVSGVAPSATQGLTQAFSQGPQSVDRQVINPYAFSPQFGQAGSLDARGALQSMLSGTPDYQGVQGAIQAANAPIMRQFEQDLLPGLNSRATFLNNQTGGVKTLNRVLPELGERMSTNAAAITDAERQRALSSQQNAANLVSQGGLSTYGLGLQGAGQQAGMNLAADTTNANLAGQFRGDLLGFGNLAGGLAGDQSLATSRALGLFPSLAAAGQIPSQDMLAQSAWQRGLAEQALGGDINRWNFGQQAPQQQLSWLNSILSGSPYQTQTTSGGSSALGTLGGALTGYQLASGLGGMFGGNQGIGLSPAQLQQAYGQIGNLNLFGP